MFVYEILCEQIMYYYKDYNYLNYLLNEDFNITYKLIVEMKKREIKQLKDKLEDRHFKIFSESKQEGLTFGQYLKNIENDNDKKTMDKKEIDVEEDRLFNKYKPKNIGG